MRFAFAVLPLLLASVACGSTAEDLADDQSSELSSKLTPAQLAQTKAALRQICNTNTLRQDNFATVRAEVQPLVDKLAKHFGVRTAKAKLPLVKGAWHEIWSDYPYMTSFANKMDLSQVYQVVSDQGHYYNLGDSKAFGLIGTTGVLRGKYAPAGSKLNIEFTNVGYRLGRLDESDNLVDLADSIESGDTSYFGIPGGGKAPRGPIGVSGTLETLYVDSDLRVDRGTQNPVLDASGKEIQPGMGEKLFILDRATTPLK